MWQCRGKTFASRGESIKRHYILTTFNPFSFLTIFYCRIFGNMFGSHKASYLMSKLMLSKNFWEHSLEICLECNCVSLEALEHSFIL